MATWKIKIPETVLTEKGWVRKLAPNPFLHL